MPFIIKKYAYPGTLSAFIHDDKHNQYVVKGPFGLGLELKPDSQGLHVAFVGGTGILPFFDLLDYLLQKAVYMVFKQASC
jgi:NAD(P)H-flavin reductase